MLRAQILDLNLSKYNAGLRIWGYEVGRHELKKCKQNQILKTDNVVPKGQPVGLEGTGVRSTLNAF